MDLVRLALIHDIGGGRLEVYEKGDLVFYSQAEEIKARLAEAESLLVEIEWTKFPSGGQLWQHCPYCNVVKKEKGWHQAGCKLAAFLKEGRL